MRTPPLALLAFVAVAGIAAPSAWADPDPIIKIGVYSQNVPGQKAEIGAVIKATEDTPGAPGASATAEGPAQAHEGGGSSTASSSSPPPVVYPTIAADSPFLRNPTPLGPGSLWYADGQGNACLYLPNSALPCYSVVPGASGQATVPAVAPGAVASALADRLGLSPGQIHASPRASALAGAASWFWLDPAPTTATVSVTLAGETVTVTAEPEVEWRFGDGGTSTGSAGVAYRPGPPPPEAVTHVYETRCLPGDRGRNPYVLGGCGQDGYPVVAVVSWRISYQANGPIDASGTLPTRTTETSTPYPVTEARAFLVGGDTQ